MRTAKFVVLPLFLLLIGAGLVQAQAVTEAQLEAAMPYSQMAAQFPGLSYSDYKTALRQVVSDQAGSGTYLGELSTNTYGSNSVSNPYGSYGSSYSSSSINNPYSTYGNPYSSHSVTNPYATDTPKLYGSDGTYLGKLSSNPYDPESISNPYGQYGSPYSPTSINNPYGTYGSPYGSQSATNPFATQPPVIIGGGR